MHQRRSPSINHVAPKRLVYKETAKLVNVCLTLTLFIFVKGKQCNFIKMKNVKSNGYSFSRAIDLSLTSRLKGNAIREEYRCSRTLPWFPPYQRDTGSWKLDHWARNPTSNNRLTASPRAALGLQHGGDAAGLGREHPPPSPLWIKVHLSSSASADTCPSMIQQNKTEKIGGLPDVSHRLSSTRCSSSSRQAV